MLISYCVLVGFRWPQMMHRHSPLHRIFRHKAIVLRNHPTYNPNAGCAESGPHYAQNPWSEPGNFWWWSLGTTLTVWTIVTDNTCAECGPHHAQTSLLRGRPGMCRMGFSDRHLLCSDWWKTSTAVQNVAHILRNLVHTREPGVIPKRKGVEIAMRAKP